MSIPLSTGDFTLSGGVTTLATGLYSFDCVNITNNAVVSIGGGVTIVCKCFNLDAGCTITGVGRGYSYSGCIGNPIGGDLICLASGGGHGGAGGSDCWDGSYLYHPIPIPVCYPGRPAHDDPVHPSMMGEGGITALIQIDTNPFFASGGGLLKILVYNSTDGSLKPATINGTIDMSGTNGNMYSTPLTHSSGGAGGTIFIEAASVDGVGALRADGGRSSGTYGLGGGGGGGIISLIENRTSFDGSTFVIGGGGSTLSGPDSNGHPGIITFTAAPATGYY
jgi:hypothetical protein